MNSLLPTAFWSNALTRVLFSIAVLLPLAAHGEESPAESESRRTKVIGWIEPVLLLPEGLLLEAKVSPSVSTSSLDAQEVEEFQKGEETWVRFVVEDRNGITQVLERPVREEKTIILTEGRKTKRRVVEMAMCVDGVSLMIEVSLSDRSKMEQEVRLGRDVLAGNFVVDPSNTHMTEPSCKKSLPSPTQTS